MENKYFTPSIEDFVYGFEYEIDAHRWHPGQNWNALNPDNPVPVTSWVSEEHWYKSTFKEPFMNGDFISSKLKLGLIRVPYLTKEQIEAEGWQSYEQFGLTHYKKPTTSINATYHLSPVISSSREHIINIYKIIDFCDRADTLFVGQCKDINTFRQICKLLNIK